MPENYQVQENARPEHTSDNVEDPFEGLNIHEDQEGEGGAPLSPSLDRPGEPDCLYYLWIGSCGYGSNCRFHHPVYAVQDVLYYQDEFPERVGEPDCEHFLKTGTCKFGSNCKFHHPKDRNGKGSISFNSLGLPMRQDEKCCRYYMRTGSCKFGSTCKFHHPEPTSLKNVAEPQNGFVAYGTSLLPSLDWPCIGRFQAWSPPRTPYTNGASLHGLQGYIPIVVYLSQGILSMPGLNTYLENPSPTNMAGSENQLDMAWEQQPLASQNFLERPNQPECHHYMFTGTCQYGGDCKFHHPKERVAQIQSTTVNPLALPSRPGQPICSNYVVYGLCKSGPTCRYDHPLLGYTYGWSLAHPSILDPSSYLNFSRTSTPLTISSETSQPISSRNSDKVNSKLSSQNKHLELKNSSDTSKLACSDSLLHMSSKELSNNKLTPKEPSNEELASKEPPNGEFTPKEPSNDES